MPVPVLGSISAYSNALPTFYRDFTFVLLFVLSQQIMGNQVTYGHASQSAYILETLPLLTQKKWCLYLRPARLYILYLIIELFTLSVPQPGKSKATQQAAAAPAHPSLTVPAAGGHGVGTAGNVQQGAQKQGFAEVQLKGNRTTSTHFVTGKCTDVHALYDFEAKELGHGHYGVVRLATHKVSKARFAIKTIRKVLIVIYISRHQISRLIFLDDDTISSLLFASTGGLIFFRPRSHVLKHSRERLTFFNSAITPTSSNLSRCIINTNFCSEHTLGNISMHSSAF